MLSKKHTFSLREYIILAMLAAIGLTSKLFIVPLVQLITGPLFIPGGVLAGGFYMMFIVLGAALVRKPGSALLVAVIQALLVTVSGSLGYHGPASLLTYAVPGLAVELWFLVSRHRGCCTFCSFVAGMLANLSGNLAVNFLIFQLPLVPLVLSLAVAALGGGLGGLAAYGLVQILSDAQALPSCENN